MQQQLPNLTTQETQRLRSDYPSIEHLEAGNVAAWLVERQEQLLVRAKDERTGMNLAKLITLAGGTVGAICYATSPLAPIGALLAGVGYIWAVAQDMNDSHQFAPIPFVRGSFIDFLEAMGDKEARGEWFANQNELVDLMFHLEPFERYEFGMLKEHAHVLSEYLVRVEPGKRFYAYRWLFDWFVNLKGTFPGVEQLTSHLETVTLDPRINYQQVEAIQEHSRLMAAPQGIPASKFSDLPETKFAELPKSKTADLPSPQIGANTHMDAIETSSQNITQPEESSLTVAPTPLTSSPNESVVTPTTTGKQMKEEELTFRYQLPTLDDISRLPMRERAIAILSRLSADGFDLSRCIADQITCICGNQRGGKGTLMAILAILESAIDSTTKIHYFTAGDDIYPFKCARLVCRLSYPDLDGDKADLMVAQELYKYLKEMDKLTQGACKDIILVIDEAVALSDYLDPEQKQWMIRFLLTRANKKGAQIFIVLHGKSLTSWVGTGNTGGFSQTFKTGATFIGCEATSIKINPLRSMSVATGRYFLADPDDFSKSVEGGELGIVPEWLKRQINPATGQPSPARTLLEFFPELRSDPQVVKPPSEKPSCSSDYQAPTDKQAWDRLILESTQEQINELIEQRRSKPSIPSDNSESLETIDQQIDFTVSAIAEYLREKELSSDTARNIYNGKNRLKKVAKTMNDFKDLLEVASEMGKISYFSDGTSTRVSLIN
jgi:hypothetical protein